MHCLTLQPLVWGGNSSLYTEVDVQLINIFFVLKVPGMLNCSPFSRRINPICCVVRYNLQMTRIKKIPLE